MEGEPNPMCSNEISSVIRNAYEMACFFRGHASCVVSYSRM